VNVLGSGHESEASAKVPNREILASANPRLYIVVAQQIRCREIPLHRGYKRLKTVWQKTLRRAKIPYFRIYDLRSAYATRLSARGVADEWVTQLLRQSDAQVFKKYSQMKLRMKREALEKLNRRANEMAPRGEADAFSTAPLCTEAVQ
jgi:integrase